MVLSPSSAIGQKTVWLQAENPAFADMQITEGQTFEVWGVITRSIRML
jgi:SOS-response transcriptional repressor LexA